MNDKKERKKIDRLSVAVPRGVREWMDGIRKSTGASHSYQVRMGLKLFAEAVKRDGVKAIWPNLSTYRTPPEKDAEAQ